MRQSSSFDDLSPDQIYLLPMYSSNPDYRKAADVYISLCVRRDSLKISIDLLKKYINRLKHGIYLRTESQEVAVQSSGRVERGKIHVHENVEDVNGEIPDEVSITSNMMNPLTDNALSVYGFLKRPVQIAAVSLNLNTNLDYTYNIWNLFLSNPGVRAKLRNFAFMRCNLNVKITVSGTPFHYGKLLVSYQPFPTVNQNLNFVASRRGAKLRYLSQAYGARTIDVRENMPFEVKIPYVSPQPMGRLFNNATVALPGLGVFDDFDDLGTLYISTLNQIKAVSTTASNIFMYIYVYASDVVLNGATGTVTTIVTESDEREVGPVEKVTSALIPVSRALEQVPSIGIFARASSIALGTLNKLSAMFGWSYPVLIDKPTRVRPDAFANGAQVIGLDTGKRITLDPKQELTVDPRIVGVPEDELAISSLCKIESLLDTFTWTSASVPLGNVIWTAAVTPRASKVDIIGVAPLDPYFATVPTSLGFCATPFKYWRGKIIYRFEIVASNFHRGKLMFYYEPNIRQNTLITSALNMNKQHVKVVDIQETQVVEFCVDWNFPRMWCENIDDSIVPTCVGTQFSNGDSKFETCNGIICVTPFTALQSPDGSSVEINVYVHSPDMAFNRVTAANYPAAIIPYTQSDEKWVANKDSTCMDIAPPIMDDSNISVLHFGEQPVSFRALLKRFQQGLVISSVTSSSFRQYNFPVYPGNLYSYDLPGANNFSPSRVPCLYNYLRWAFLAQKGGMRKRLRIQKNNSNHLPDFRVNVSLRPDESVTPGAGWLNGGTGTVRGPVMDGTVTFMTDVNSGMEFEIPFYSNNLFSWACNADPWFNTGLSVMQVDNLRSYNVDIDGFDATNSSIYVSETFATGEDFTFMRWMGSPPVRLNATVS